VLKEQFGTEWKEWSKRVPYKLVPYVFWHWDNVLWNL
jgi:hypothetical protein